MQKLHIASSDKPVREFSLDVIINCRLLDDAGLVAHTLLVAESAADQKESSSTSS